LSERKERELFFKGKVMALSCSKNYFHWLLKMLPRLELMERSAGSLDEIEAFFINKPTWQQQEVYQRLKIWDRCVVIDRKSFAVCRLLGAPTIAHDAPEWACRFVRRKLGPAETPAGKRRIYVVRGKTAHRELVNEQEVTMLLRGYGFEIVDCSVLTVEEQAGVFAESEIVVGVHGAAFSNLVFCNPGATVLEVFGTQENQKGYWVMSHRMKLQYYYLMAQSVESGGQGNMANIVIELKVLARNIEVILEGKAGVVAKAG